MNLVLFGPPGSGKGTQSQRICSTYKMHHLSTGDALRAAIRARTELGVHAEEVIGRGELVSDDMVTELVRSTVSNMRASSDSFLFDGYPRTLTQAGQLDELLASFHLPPPAVVNLHVPDETLLLRMTGRRICADCRRTFNVYFNPSRQAGVCDVCKGPLLKRVDDNAETIRERLRIYHDQCVPVLKEYERRGTLDSIDATGSEEEVFGKISRILTEHY